MRLVKVSELAEEKMRPTESKRRVVRGIGWSILSRSKIFEKILKPKKENWKFGKLGILGVCMKRIEPH